MFITFPQEANIFSLYEWSILSKKPLLSNVKKGVYFLGKLLTLLSTTELEYTIFSL